jgi:NADH-quinone oxidoreductase subunit L
MTHAFFKACLFLGSGSVIHGMHAVEHDEVAVQDMRNMGGLKRVMPITARTYFVACLAITAAPIPFFAGFWSKDEILATAGQGGFEIFMVIGLVGAFLTAAYMTRCVWLTFFGEYRGHHHPHESPKAITIPLIVLAGFSIVAGLANASAFGIEKFKEYIEPHGAFFPPVLQPDFDIGLAAASFAIVVIAIGIGLFFWLDRKELRALKGLTQRSGAAKAGHTFLLNKYYLDHLYTDTVVAGIKGPIARASYWVNMNVIDGVVNGVGRGSAALGRVVYRYVDQDTVDGAVNGLARETDQAGGLLRPLQSGRLQRYALFLFASVGVIALAIAIFG